MDGRERHRIEISGAVQGVGFRPLVARLAEELELAGWAANSLAGLEIEIEGRVDACAFFLQRVRTEAPPHASLRAVHSCSVPIEGEKGFVIRDSSVGPSGAATEMTPDLAVCEECLKEMLDPASRRHAYPFTNCTQCGPRFSIMLALPYDRGRTTMRSFTMCAQCREEYESRGDRRFHAQPIACAECGPQIAFADASGRTLATREEALERAARAIESGQIVAVKGIGGFHLLVDARSEESIRALRARKHRPGKPLALMMPGVDSVRAHCAVSPLEEDLLTSARAPIVVLQRLGSELPGLIAPGQPTLGVMLPYSPLHHLLMRRLGFPVAATSGNLTDEPLCSENDEAFQRLLGIADAFLTHDRLIAQPVDDSVVRVVLGRELLLRRARGYAPLSLPGSFPCVLAVGGDQKVALAVSGPCGIRVAQHAGDLEGERSQDLFLAQCRDFPALCGVRPRAVACDLHPGYHSRRLADEMGLPVVPVQHHHAHIAACLGEHEVHDEVLGVAWDGTGFGEDGTIWGGEFLLATQEGFRRIAHLRRFPLPGGELAIRQPRLAALGLLHEAGIALAETPLAAAFTAEEIAIARVQAGRGVNAPLTSSAGRLFEALAALLGLRWRNEYEAQAAQELEFAAQGCHAPFSMPAAPDGVLDWSPMVRALLEGWRNNVPVAVLAARIIETMGAAVVAVAQTAGKSTVVLSGGCFQNALLLETVVARLRAAGFSPLWPRFTPPNDGGLALGQAIVAARRLSSSST